MVGCLSVCVDLPLHDTVCGHVTLHQKSVCTPQTFDLTLLAPVDDFLQCFVFFTHVRYHGVPPCLVDWK